jgi:hypothetical protein
MRIIFDNYSHVHLRMPCSHRTPSPRQRGRGCAYAWRPAIRPRRRDLLRPVRRYRGRVSAGRPMCFGFVAIAGSFLPVRYGLPHLSGRCRLTVSSLPCCNAAISENLPLGLLRAPRLAGCARLEKRHHPSSGASQPHAGRAGACKSSHTHTHSHLLDAS